MGRSSLQELSTARLFEAWAAVKDELDRLTLEGASRAEFARRRGRYREVVAEIEDRYKPVFDPILIMLAAGHDAERDQMLEEFAGGFLRCLVALSRSAEARHHPRLMWNCLEEEIEGIMDRWRIQPGGDFRWLKPRFMARLFVDELRSDDRETLVDCCYSPAEIAPKRPDALAQQLAKALRALHQTLRGFRDQLDELTDGAIRAALVREIDESQQYPRYLAELRLIRD